MEIPPLPEKTVFGDVRSLIARWHIDLPQEPFREALKEILRRYVGEDLPVALHYIFERLGYVPYHYWVTSHKTYSEAPSRSPLSFWAYNTTPFGAPSASLRAGLQRQFGPDYLYPSCPEVNHTVQDCLLPYRREFAGPVSSELQVQYLFEALTKALTLGDLTSCPQAKEAWLFLHRFTSHISQSLWAWQVSDEQRWLLRLVFETNPEKWGHLYTSYLLRNSVFCEGAYLSAQRDLYWEALGETVAQALLSKLMQARI